MLKLEEASIIEAGETAILEGCIYTLHSYIISRRGSELEAEVTLILE